MSITGHLQLPSANMHIFTWRKRKKVFHPNGELNWNILLPSSSSGLPKSESVPQLTSHYGSTGSAGASAAPYFLPNKYLRPSIIHHLVNPAANCEAVQIDSGLSSTPDLPQNVPILRTFQWDTDLQPKHNGNAAKKPATDLYSLQDRIMEKRRKESLYGSGLSISKRSSCSDLQSSSFRDSAPLTAAASKKSASSASLPNPVTLDNVRQVIFLRTPGQTLGMAISLRTRQEDDKVEQVLVKTVVPRGPAARKVNQKPILQEGDEILWLNDDNLSTLTRSQCVELFQDAPLCFTMLIRRQHQDASAVVPSQRCSDERFLKSQTMSAAAGTMPAKKKLRRPVLPPPPPPLPTHQQTAAIKNDYYDSVDAENIYDLPCEEFNCDSNATVDEANNQPIDHDSGASVQTGCGTVCPTENNNKSDHCAPDVQQNSSSKQKFSPLRLTVEGGSPFVTPPAGSHGHRRGASSSNQLDVNYDSCQSWHNRCQSFPPSLITFRNRSDTAILPSLEFVATDDRCSYQITQQITRSDVQLSRCSDAESWELSRNSVTSDPGLYILPDIHLTCSNPNSGVVENGGFGADQRSWVRHETREPNGDLLCELGQFGLPSNNDHAVTVRNSGGPAFIDEDSLRAARNSLVSIPENKDSNRFPGDLASLQLEPTSADSSCKKFCLDKQFILDCEDLIESSVDDFRCKRLKQVTFAASNKTVTTPSIVHPFHGIIPRSQRLAAILASCDKPTAPDNKQVKSILKKSPRNSICDNSLVVIPFNLEENIAMDDTDEQEEEDTVHQSTVKEQDEPLSGEELSPTTPFFSTGQLLSVTQSVRQTCHETYLSAQVDNAHHPQHHCQQSPRTDYLHLHYQHQHVSVNSIIPCVVPSGECLTNPPKSGSTRNSTVTGTVNGVFNPPDLLLHVREALCAKLNQDYSDSPVVDGSPSNHNQQQNLSPPDKAAPEPVFPSSSTVISRNNSSEGHLHHALLSSCTLEPRNEPNLKETQQSDIVARPSPQTHQQSDNSLDNWPCGTKLLKSHPTTEPHSHAIIPPRVPAASAGDKDHVDVVSGQPLQDHRRWSADPTTTHWKTRSCQLAKPVPPPKPKFFSSARPNGCFAERGVCSTSEYANLQSKLKHSDRGSTNCCVSLAAETTTKTNSRSNISSDQCRVGTTAKCVSPPAGNRVNASVNLITNNHDSSHQNADLVSDEHVSRSEVPLVTTSAATTALLFPLTSRASPVLVSGVDSTFIIDSADGLPQLARNSNSNTTLSPSLQVQRSEVTNNGSPVKKPALSVEPNSPSVSSFLTELEAKRAKILRKLLDLTTRVTEEVNSSEESLRTASDNGDLFIGNFDCQMTDHYSSTYLSENGIKTSVDVGHEYATSLEWMRNSTDSGNFSADTGTTHLTDDGDLTTFSSQQSQDDTTSFNTSSVSISNSDTSDLEDSCSGESGSVEVTAHCPHHVEGGERTLELLHTSWDIGIKVQLDDRDRCVICQLTRNSPLARLSNVNEGDILKTINGQSLDGMTEGQVSTLLRALPRGLVRISVLPGYQEIAEKGEAFASDETIDSVTGDLSKEKMTTNGAHSQFTYSREFNYGVSHQFPTQSTTTIEPLARAEASIPHSKSLHVGQPAEFTFKVDSASHEGTVPVLRGYSQTQHATSTLYHEPPQKPTTFDLTPALPLSLPPSTNFPAETDYDATNATSFSASKRNFFTQSAVTSDHSKRASTPGNVDPYRVGRDSASDEFRKKREKFLVNGSSNGELHQDEVKVFSGKQHYNPSSATVSVNVADRKSRFASTENLHISAQTKSREPSKVYNVPIQKLSESQHNGSSHQRYSDVHNIPIQIVDEEKSKSLSRQTRDERPEPKLTNGKGLLSRDERQESRLTNGKAAHQTPFVPQPERQEPKLTNGKAAPVTSIPQPPPVQPSKSSWQDRGRSSSISSASSATSAQSLTSTSEPSRQEAVTVISESKVPSGTRDRVSPAQLSHQIAKKDLSKKGLSPTIAAGAGRFSQAMARYKAQTESVNEDGTSSAKMERRSSKPLVVPILSSSVLNKASMFEQKANQDPGSVPVPLQTSARARSLSSSSLHNIMATSRDTNGTSAREFKILRTQPEEELEIWPKENIRTSRTAASIPKTEKLLEPPVVHHVRDSGVSSSSSSVCEPEPYEKANKDEFILEEETIPHFSMEKSRPDHLRAIKLNGSHSEVKQQIQVPVEEPVLPPLPPVLAPAVVENIVSKRAADPNVAVNQKRSAAVAEHVKISALPASDEQSQLIEMGKRLLARDAEQETVFIVNLLRPDGASGGGVGIVLTGGADYENSQIKVNKVITHSLAHRDGRVMPGDRLLMINGQPCSNMTHRQALDVLKAPRAEVSLVLSRLELGRPESNLSEEFPAPPSPLVASERNLQTVTMHADKGGLGITVDGGHSALGVRPLTIRRVTRGSTVSNPQGESQLGVGDELISINGVDCAGLSRVDCIKLLKGLPEGPVTIRIRKADLLA